MPNVCHSISRFYRRGRTFASTFSTCVINLFSSLNVMYSIPLLQPQTPHQTWHIAPPNADKTFERVQTCSTFSYLLYLLPRSWNHSRCSTLWRDMLWQSWHSRLYQSAASLRLDWALRDSLRRPILFWEINRRSSMRSTIYNRVAPNCLLTRELWNLIGVIYFTSCIAGNGCIELVKRAL